MGRSMGTQCTCGAATPLTKAWRQCGHGTLARATFILIVEAAPPRQANAKDSVGYLTSFSFYSACALFRTFVLTTRRSKPQMMLVM